MATLTGLFEPSDLLSMFRTPTNSHTARTVLPAMIPVPGEAGRNSTLAPSYRLSTSCGMVVSKYPHPQGGCGRPRRPCECSRQPDWPCPAPCPRPFLSPTTTVALKPKRRPPLTTLAERLMHKTFSENSSCGSSDGPLSRRRIAGRPPGAAPSRAATEPGHRAHVHRAHVHQALAAFAVRAALTRLAFGFRSRSLFCLLLRQPPERRRWPQRFRFDSVLLPRFFLKFSVRPHGLRQPGRLYFP